MKLRSLAVAALAAMTLAACSKDGDNGKTATEGEAATLKINISSPASRAIGTPVSGDAVIDNYSVFVVSSGGTIQASKHSATTDAMVLTADDGITTDAARVYVVANAGDVTSLFTSESALLDEKRVWSASDWPTVSDKLHMATGSTSGLNFTSDGNGNNTAMAAVELNFVYARITVKVIDDMEGFYDKDADDGSLILSDVAVLNVPQKSKIFGSSLAVTGATENYLSGLSTSFTYTPDYNINSTDLIDGGFDFDNKYYFYVYENDASTAAQFPTIVTLVGEFGKGAKRHNVYYPVYLAPFETWTSGDVQSLERGKSYDITITMTVDPTIDKENGGNGDGDEDGGDNNNGNGGGTTDPTVPDESVNLTISVKLNDWDPVVLNKEF